MNIDSNWFLFLVVAASAAAGAVVASTARRRRDRNAHHEHKSALTSWENEGGNVAPIPASEPRN